MHLLGELLALVIVVEELVLNAFVLDGELRAVAVGIFFDLVSFAGSGGFSLVGDPASVGRSLHIIL